ncbi:MAG: cytochrome c [Actinobacteria bacterium]|nr:cytochrome c [Actinomycetota bacterium]
MPADIVTGQDANDVAAYVAAVAGQPVAGGSTAPPPPAATGEDDGGKSVFASAGCGGCHTLADAGAGGTVGPNLDETKPAKELVADRVTNGKGVMPPFAEQLSDAQIEAVAQYVSSVAGK